MRPSPRRVAGVACLLLAAALPGRANAQEPVAWTNAVGVAPSGSDLTKTAAAAWGNAGASSTKGIHGGYGYAEFTVPTTPGYAMCGLSNGDTDQGYGDIDFALYTYVASGSLFIYEKGVYRGTAGRYAAGDVLRVTVDSGVVTYSRNGVAVYTSTQTAAYPLRVDTALYDTGARIEDATLAGTLLDVAPPVVPVEAVAWTDAVGVAPSGSDLTKTAAAAWGNAGASSTKGIQGGYGYAEFTVPTTPGYAMCGLSNGDTDQGYGDIDFALYTYVASRSLLIYEKGVYRGTAGRYAAGDVLRVTVDSGVVTYSRNGVVVYTSTQTAAYPLRVDTALYDTGARVEGATIAGTLVDVTPPMVPVEAVVWTNAVGVTPSGSDLTKTAATKWGNAGASSTMGIQGGYGYAEFTVPVTPGYAMCGLSNGDTDQGYGDIDFAFYPYAASGSLLIYEKGVYRGTAGRYAAGDVLRVTVASGVVTYSRNGVVVYTSAQAAAYPLRVDTALYNTGARIEGATLAGTLVDVRPPVPADDSASTDEDTAVLIAVLANDADPSGDPLSVSAVTEPVHGAVVNNGTDVTYTPAADFCGLDSFAYTATDGSGFATATVSVDVVCVNDDPAAVDDTALVAEGGSVVIDVLGNDSDVDGDLLAVTAVSDPANGAAVALGDGTIEYSPDGGFTGVDSFTYEVSDGNGGSASATVTVTVTAAGPVTVSFQQGVAGYAGTVDTFLMESNPATSRGAEAWVEWDADDPGGSGSSNFGLVRFDGVFGSGAGQVPVGATIQSATLSYVVSDGGDPADVNAVVVDWAEDVTWAGFGGVAGVQAEDYGAAVGSASGSTAGTFTLDVTASLAAWSADPSANRGWIFRPTGAGGVELRSSEYATVAERPRLSVIYWVGPINQAPAAPALVTPADGATGVATSPDLEVSVSDPEGDALTVTFYGRAAGAAAPGEDFTIIAMPDTQHYTDNPAYAANFAAQTQWIVDNRAARNIVFVTGLGDIVQNGNANDSEWQLANAAYGLIEDPSTTLLADGIPYGLSVGNHDQTPIGGGSTASTTKYNEYFGTARFTGRGYYGGSETAGNNDNHYELFSAGGMDFIIIHFEYDTTPEPAVLAWAEGLLDTYSDRRAIVSTHYLIGLGNPGAFGAQGQAIYDALSDHENLFLMVAGHIHGEGRRQDTGPNGNVIHTLLSDYQDYPNGGNGFLRIMTFSPAAGTIQVETYSPVLDQYETDDSSQFTLAYDMTGAPAFEVLGTTTVASGSTASVSWPGRAAGTEYEWYATVADAYNTTTSSTWTFTTGGVDPALVPPDTTLLVTPADPTTSDTASFEFTGTDNLTAPASLTFECELDGGGFGACTSPASYSGLGLGAHTFSVRAIDGDLNVDPTPASFTWTIDPVPGASVLEFRSVLAGTSPVTVALTNVYASPVVVCSAQYANNSVPVVTRVGSVGPTSFTVRLQNPSGAAVAAENVSCLVVEEGVWSVGGVRFEAQTYLSTVTDENGSWTGQAQAYGQSYASPVVVGQVMSENDPSWSVFWARGGATGDPPSATTLVTGKTVAEDTDVTRANETIGFVVFEAGHGVLEGVEFEAGLGANTIQGVGDAPPYTYAFTSPFLAAPQVAVVSLAGMNGTNGGWAQTHGSPLATATSLSLSVDEDQVADTERSHIAEQVAYVAFGPAVDNEPPVAADDGAVVAEDASVIVDVLANDTDLDGDTLSVSAVVPPTHGGVVNGGTDVTYTPNPNYCGTDTFGYTVSDGNTGTDTATVSVTVTCVNDSPVAVADTASVATGGSVVVLVLANDVDIDGSGLTVTGVTQGANGGVGFDATSVAYTHDGSATTSDTFTYTVTDGEGDTSTATVSVTVRPSQAGRPNFLILIADDVGLDVTTDLYPGLLDSLYALYSARGHANAAGVYGQPASVPFTLDRIAQQGMTFSAAWAQPVCSPTRAAIITGLYAAKTGVTAPGSPLPDAPMFTFVERLQDEGWRTALFGKWHLGTNTNGVLPQETGFDLFRGHTGGGLEDFWNYSYQVQDGATTNPSQYRTDPTPSKSLPGIASTTFAPVVKAADAIETINAWESADPDTPWLVWTAFNQAHWPMHVPNADTLDAASLAEVTGCGGVPGTNTRGSCSDAVLVRAMTNSMDTVIETVVNAVEAADPNTYVIFIGDNGTESDSIANMYLTSSGRGKGTVYESGARVALAISGPGIAPGSTSGEFVHAADLFATVLDLAGLPVPSTNFNLSGASVASDSVSLAPILLGSSTTVRDPNEGYILTETSYLGYKAAARNATHKVICTGSTSSCSFYDLVADPLEEYPLAKPGSCTGYRTTWTTANPEWHYCRLLEVVESESGL